MKRIVLGLMFTLGLYGFAEAQNRKIEDAKISLGQNDLETAKADIEEAAKNPETANLPKMWAVRGTVYLRIATEENAKHLDAEAPVKAMESYLNCIRLDRAAPKRKFKDVEEEYLLAVVPCFNYGVDKNMKGTALLNEGKTEEGKAMMRQCLNAWDLVRQAYEFDTKNQIKNTYNISQISLNENLANAYITLGEHAKAQDIFSTIQKEKLPSIFSFTRSAYLYMEDGDTTNAMAVIEKGRGFYPENKDLVNMELMIYQNQGKVDVLTDKLTAAIEISPDNANLIYNRGILYDNRARLLAKAYTDEVEKWYRAREKMKRASNPADKAKLKTEGENAEKAMDKFYSEQRRLDSLAIVDYKRAYELEPDKIEAAAALGVIYFNSVIPLIEKANNLPTDNTYEKKYTELEKQWLEVTKESLKWFLIAEQIDGSDETVLAGLQQAYARMGDQQKAMEYKKKREE